MRQRTPRDRSRQPDALVIQIILACISILLSLLLLFVPQVSISVLCYFFCGGLVAVGVGMIVSFFLAEAYKQMHNYFFSLGVMSIILGCCGLLRNSELCDRFTFFIGVTALVLSVFILQNMVQMRVLHSFLWVVELVLAVPSIIGAVLVLVDLKPLLKKLPSFPNWALLIASGLSLVSLLLTSLGLLAVNRHTQAQPGGNPPAPIGTVPGGPAAAPVNVTAAPTMPRVNVPETPPAPQEPAPNPPQDPMA